MSPVTNTFSANTKIKSAEVNENFTDLEGKVVYMFLSLPPGSASVTSYTSLASFPYNRTSGNINTIKFHIVIFASSGGTAYAQLYNKTTASAVSGSEVSTTSTSTDNWEVSGDIFANLATGFNSYGVQLKTSDAEKSVYYSSAYLEITYK